MAVEDPCSRMDPMEIAFPRINWREPIKIVTVFDGVRRERWGCRLCIAKQGILHNALLDHHLYDERRHALLHIAQHLSEMDE